MPPTAHPVDYFKDLGTLVRLAIEEDIGPGDITVQLVPKGQIATAVVITRENAVVCGRPWFDEVFRQIDGGVSINWLVSEGDDVAPEQTLVELSGPVRSILTAERCALNFMQTLMGTATTSREYAQLVKNSGTRILDTRKTIPGLRLAQKYAVKIGGCENHRLGLYDAFLIKDNHITACGGLAEAVSRARKISPGAPVEVEVETIDELHQAIDSGADRIMLDNFSQSQLEQAASAKDGTFSFEVSGNKTATDLAEMTGHHIDYLSSGALTKHVHSIDLSMRLIMG